MKKILVFAAALACTYALDAQTPLPKIEETQLEVRAFSHRGGRLERDENTIKSFQESWDAGYTGFETDIRMTKDGVLYLTHDNTLERTTNGTGIFEEKTSAEIDKLLTKHGNKIAKLEDFCKFLDGKDGLYVEFELKTMAFCKPYAVGLYPRERMEEMVDKAHAMIAKIRTKNSHLLFTSADYRGLQYAREKYPDMELLLIVNKPVCDETIQLCQLLGINAIGAMTQGTSREMVKKAKEAGLIVSLWPSKTIEDFLLGSLLGSDRLCCDVPLTVKNYLEKYADQYPWLKVTY